MKEAILSPLLDQGLDCVDVSLLLTYEVRPLLTYECLCARLRVCCTCIGMRV